MKLEANKKIEDNNLTEDQIQALYIYLAMNYDTMNEEEKKTWYYIMENIDSEFKEDEL